MSVGKTTRKPATDEQRICALILRYRLRAVELSVSDGAHARALPAAYSLIVAARLKEITAKGESDQDRISEQAMQPIAYGHGSSIATSLSSLEFDLKRAEAAFKADAFPNPAAGASPTEGNTGAVAAAAPIGGAA